jgi:hydroxymethylbilane synthase
MTLRLGTRGSRLALAQSQAVADAITATSGRPVELVEIVTAGDRSSAPIPTLGVGVFTSALRDALLDKHIDLAVHSYKDLPSAPHDRLTIAAVPPREDPRDALVARDNLTLSELPAGARIGTSAVRRVAQLRALGRPLTIEPLRGNVDTRLGKVASGQLDAVVLARAGLARLGRADAVTEVLDPLLMLPAPAQGALAVECRVDDLELVEVLRVLDDLPSRAVVTAERALLAALEAGCNAPIAALAEIAEADLDEPGHGRYEIYLRGAVLSLDGSTSVRLSRTGTQPAGAAGEDIAWCTQIGRLLAADLIDAGIEHFRERPRDPEDPTESGNAS